MTTNKWRIFKASSDGLFYDALDLRVGGVPEELDKFIVRLLALFQLLASVLVLLRVFSALNDGAPFSPTVIPLLCLYALYGLVSGIFLYSTRNTARIVALGWYGGLVAVVLVQWFFAAQPRNGNGDVLLLLSSLSLLYLAITSLTRFRAS